MLILHGDFLTPDLPLFLFRLCRGGRGGGKTHGQRELANVLPLFSGSLCCVPKQDLHLPVLNHISVQTCFVEPGDVAMT